MIINGFDYGESLDTEQKQSLYESFMIESLQDYSESVEYDIDFN